MIGLVENCVHCACIIACGNLHNSNDLDIRTVKIANIDRSSSIRYQHSQASCRTEQETYRNALAHRNSISMLRLHHACGSPEFSVDRSSLLFICNPYVRTYSVLISRCRSSGLRHTVTCPAKRNPRSSALRDSGTIAGGIIVILRPGYDGDSGGNQDADTACCAYHPVLSRF